MPIGVGQRTGTAIANLRVRDLRRQDSIVRRDIAWTHDTFDTNVLTTLIEIKQLFSPHLQVTVGKSFDHSHCDITAQTIAPTAIALTRKVLFGFKGIG